ncbi:MAG: sulfotransferase family protein [Hyphomonas sp.]|uniref:sulfotransferase family protein n=1 Tax=Hyphomonas sp. TaxID=87 RepID=UPI00349FFA81
MTLKVISAGFGRTGTLSLKLALEELGFGPCHHMKEVPGKQRRAGTALKAGGDGTPNFAAICRGYRSAVDWPTAAFWREVAAANPDTKIILSTRSPESW